MRLPVFAAALAALVAIVATIPAYAHDLSVAHVDLVVAADDPRELAVEVDLAVKDLALTLPVDANRDEVVTWGELLVARGQIEALDLEGMTLASAGGTCRLQPGALATRRYDDGAYATLQVAASCPDAGPWSLQYTLFRDRDAQHRAISTLRNGAVTATAIAGGSTGVVGFKEQNTHVLSSFAREGVRHLLIGADHLAFLLSLVLPALLTWNGHGWRPATSVGPQLKQTVCLVTAFTLAHSATLSLAALGWVTPASGPVEAAIAASVLLAALNNLRPVVTRRLWLLSFCFGLVHGFGFAGALGELGLPRHDRVLALLGFNVGVELGQLAVLAVLLPLLVLVRRPAAYARFVVPGASLAIAGVAMAWIVQRVGA
jgi:hypothetical protein